jgi:CBS domain containing-hemolysin-like protein
VRVRRNRGAGDQIRADVSAQEETILAGLASLRDATAREVMTPRMDLVTLKAPVHFEDVARAVRRSGHSHFPVYEEDLDRLLGVLFVKDLFHKDLVRLGTRNPRSESANSDASADDADPDFADRVRQPFIVPESRSALELLAEMRKLRRGFAVVVDEYGGVAGVVTINDLVSELVGDIQDEFDRTATPTITKVDQNRFLIDGACDVDEVRETLGIPIRDGEYVTLGGFLLDRFGRIPEEGDEIVFHGWKLRVARMIRRRIAKVVVHSPSATIDDQDESGEGAGSSDGK